MTHSSHDGTNPRKIPPKTIAKSETEPINITKKMLMLCLMTIVSLVYLRLGNLRFKNSPRREKNIMLGTTTAVAKTVSVTPIFNAMPTQRHATTAVDTVKIS